MASAFNSIGNRNFTAMIGQPGYMPPPPIQGVSNDPTSNGGYKASPPQQSQFNPTGGIGVRGQFGNPVQSTSGGPGWMPPPPIQGVGDGVGGTKGPPQRLPPGRMPFQFPGQAFGPPVPFTGGAPNPGWAGYLQWLQGAQQPQGWFPQRIPPAFQPPQQPPPNWWMPPPQIGPI